MVPTTPDSFFSHLLKFLHLYSQQRIRVRAKKRKPPKKKEEKVIVFVYFAFTHSEFVLFVFISFEAWAQQKGLKIEDDRLR